MKKKHKITSMKQHINCVIPHTRGLHEKNSILPTKRKLFNRNSFVFSGLRDLDRMSKVILLELRLKQMMFQAKVQIKSAC